MPSRTLAIGDIHGGLLALQQALQRVAIMQTDTLIFLGDYVDGWSESAATLNYLLTLKETYNCVFLKGNHDQLLEEWLTGGKDNPLWLKHGGTATVQSYVLVDDETKQKHIKFIQSMPNYLIDNQNRLFVHAGFTSIHGPQTEYQDISFRWDRTLWEVALCLDHRINIDSNRYPKRLRLFEEIFIGHTPTTNYHTDCPMHCANVWNIDTGAAFTGKVTILDIDSKQYWQSDIVQSLYPEERGRN
jgi:serine/threonine protein phosphatase 1